MAALPYMQLYVADYLAEASHLSALQHGAYLLLMFNYWQRGQALSNSNDRLANVARMSSDEWLEHRAVLAEFFQVDGDTWRHAGIEAALQLVADKSAKARGAGEASARKRAAPAEPIPSVRATDVEQTVNHKEKDKEKDSKQGEKQTRASRLPADWTPTLDDITFCRTERPDLDPEVTANRFRDYWCASSGANGRKLDWAATWRNWVRNEKARPGTAGSAATRLDPSWTPSPDDLAFCRTERPDLDPHTTASRFRDYWCAAPADKGRKVDWSATWRNWVRDEKVRTHHSVPAQAGTHLGNAGQSTKNAALDWLGATP